MSGFLQYLEKQSPNLQSKKRLKLEDAGLSGKTRFVVLSGGSFDTDELCLVSKIRLWCEQNDTKLDVITPGQLCESTPDIDKNNSVIIPRDFSYPVSHTLETWNDSGVLSANSFGCIKTCLDVYKTHKILTESNIPSVKTCLVSSSGSTYGKFPVSLSTLGSGCSVLVESNQSLSTLVDAWSTVKKSIFVLQEHADKPKTKVQVLGGEVTASQENISKDVEKICVEAVRAVGGVWAEVEVVNEQVLRINPFPTAEEYINGQHTLEKTLDFLKERTNLKRPKIICGGQQEIILEDVGKINARFNLVGSSKSCLFVHDLKINPTQKTVKFKIDGVAITELCEEIIKIKRNGIESQRCTVRLDVVLNEMKFNNVEFFLDEKKDCFAMLNKDFTSNAGIIVDASK